jgi:uncharacterized spore protein YtfJ
MASETKRYLAIIQLKKDSTIQRVADDVPEIVEFIKRFSKSLSENIRRDYKVFGA